MIDPTRFSFLRHFPSPTFSRKAAWIILTVLMLLSPLTAARAQEQGGTVSVTPSPLVQMAQSAENKLEQYRAELANLNELVRQLEDVGKAVQAQNKEYDIQNTTHGQLLLKDQVRIGDLEAAIRENRLASNALSEQIDRFQSDLDAQRGAFFARIAEERIAAIAQLQEALQTTVKQSVDMANARVETQRTAAIDQLFDRLALERTRLLDDFAARQNELLGVMTELKQTITVSADLARNLTDTVKAVDQVVARFDRAPDSQREPLRMTDVRDAAIETGHAAEKVTLLLERLVILLESESWDQRVATLAHPTDAVINAVFWRGAILIGLLILGIGLLRMVPQRISEGRKG